MNYYLGIDIGTTTSKAVAFSEKGEVLASFAFGYDMQHPQPGYSEQDPEAILRAILQGIQKVVQTLAPDYPKLVSFSAAMHSLILVDEQCNLLTPCIIWADNRSSDIAENLKNSEDGKSFYEATGVPIHAMTPLCKLLWFSQNQSAVFHAAFKFIGIKEYIFYKLFGEFIVDTSVASATGLLNSKTLQWDDAILHFLRIDAGKLSGVVSTKHILYYKNTYAPLSLPTDIPFVIGASDGALSNLGTGATSGGALAVSIGTSSAARTLLTTPETDGQMRTFCYHVKDNYYIAGGASNNGAVVLQWVKEKLLQTEESFDALSEQAATIAPGSEGLLLLPFILGERAPIWNAQAKGVYFGLDIRHTKAHIIRAAMEGVIFSVYSIVKIIGEQRHISEIYASGGFVKSSLWLQMLADMCNLKVLVSGALEGTALGAVMLGAEALGVKADFENRILATYYPDGDHQAVYAGCFDKFERLYQLLKDEMN